MSELATRLHRLERPRGLISSGDPVVARDLADNLGVSLRTLMRDLDVLRDDGLLIEADRGRGGGVRLARGHGTGRINLHAAEAIDLLISIAVAEKMHSPLMPENLRAVRQKLAIAFARSHVEQIRQLRRRILIGHSASARVVAEYRPERCIDIETVRLAFFERRVLALSYEDEQARQTERQVEPHYLYLNAPAWYLLAWDHLREDVRTFRIDRIRSARAGETTFRLRDQAIFLKACEQQIETL
jgi:predicted DNA-binding transcriptional regulator YafY